MQVCHHEIVEFLILFGLAAVQVTFYIYSLVLIYYCFFSNRNKIIVTCTMDAPYIQFFYEPND